MQQLARPCASRPCAGAKAAACHRPAAAAAPARLAGGRPPLLLSNLCPSLSASHCTGGARSAVVAAASPGDRDVSTRCAMSARHGGGAGRARTPRQSRPPPPPPLQSGGGGHNACFGCGRTLFLLAAGNALAAGGRPALRRWWHSLLSCATLHTPPPALPPPSLPSAGPPRCSLRRRRHSRWMRSRPQQPQRQHAGRKCPTRSSTTRYTAAPSR